MDSQKGHSEGTATEPETSGENLLKKKSWKERACGGPHKVGDPDDKHIRHAERDNIIARMVEHRIAKEHCATAIQEWVKCCEKNDGFWVWHTCRPFTKAMNDCKAKWNHNEELWAEMTAEFLERRTKYRATGIPQPADYEKGNKRYDKGEKYRAGREVYRTYHKFLDGVEGAKEEPRRPYSRYS